MNQKERMLAELPYIASDEVLSRERMECKRKIYELNNVHPDQYNRIPGLLKELFGKTGETVFVEPPFHCDYGYNIEVGENFFANYNCTVLDVAKVQIGKNVMLGPNVSFYTAGHPLHHESRNSGYEYGISITVGDNVWIGGSVAIMAGVSIGNIMVRCCKLRNNLLYFINIICVYLLSEKRLTNNLLWYNINQNYIDIRD